MKTTDLFPNIAKFCYGYGSPIVKILDHGRHVLSSSPVPLKVHRVGQRLKLNLSRGDLSDYCGVVIRRGGTSSNVVHVI
ncbi:hypothetical protein TNCV_1962611 [Trichonephila clavipes]|nr:hypothetical protein TNCV_1962611 [Trichonephila clavipes]